MRVSFGSYFNPWSKDHTGLKNFKVIPKSEKMTAVIISSFAGVLSFGILALPVFRLLTKSSEPAQVLANKVGKIWEKTVPAQKAVNWHRSVIAANLDQLQSLVEKGVDINKKGHRGYSALHYALLNKNEEKFKYLIENGGDINCKDHFGSSLLGLAIKKNQLNFVEILIQRGASFDNCDSKGGGALHLACRQGHLPSIHLLLKAGASATGQDKGGLTPLAHAKINKVKNYDEIEKAFFKYASLPISYEKEFTQRQLIIHAFSLNHTPPLLSKNGERLPDVELNLYPFILWEEMEKNLVKMDCFHKTTQKIILESIAFAKNQPNSAEIYQRWKEGKPVIIENAGALLYKDHFITVNQMEQKKFRIDKEEILQLIQNLKKSESHPSCFWSNQQGAVIALLRMLENNPAVGTAFLLQQKCQIAEEYLDAIHDKAHAFYPSPQLLAEMAVQLREEDERTSVKIESALTELQGISLEPLSEQAKKEWKIEMKKAREVLYIEN